MNPVGTEPCTQAWWNPLVYNLSKPPPPPGGPWLYFLPYCTEAGFFPFMLPSHDPWKSHRHSLDPFVLYLSSDSLMITYLLKYPAGT